MNKPKKWEVWYAFYAYEDEPDSGKNRPVLVLENKDFYPILAAKVTSAKPREGFAGEYRIEKWKEAGLEKPSTIRLSKRLKLDEEDFKFKIGRLTPNDIIKVQSILKNMMM